MQRGVNKRWFFACALVLLIVGVVAYGTSSPSTFGHSAGEIEGLSSFLGDAIPTGAILLFNTTCPSGWTRFSGLDGRVPKGGITPGIFGGLDTHSHTYQSSMATNLDGGSWRSAIATLSINPSSSWPPFLTMIWCMKTSSGGGGSGGVTAGVYDSGWVLVGSLPIASGRSEEKIFTHNLGTKAISITVYVADDSVGTNQDLLHDVQTQFGYAAKVLDNNSIKIKIRESFMPYDYVFGTPTEPLGGKYIRAIVS